MGAVQQIASQPCGDATAYRIVQETDVPWMLALAKRRYSNRWDFEAAEMWFESVVLRQPLVFYPIRSDNSFVVTLISIIPWMPAEWEANVVWCCADDGAMWEALALLRESLAWAKRRKCVEWRFRSETDFDTGPMARRLGAHELPTNYAVRL